MGSGGEEPAKKPGDLAATPEAVRARMEETDRANAERQREARRRALEGADRDSGLDRDHELIVAAQPIYPRRALMRNIEGSVLLEYVVTATGAVVNPVVIEAEPQGFFERAAIQTVLKHKYKPRVVNGRAVAARGVRGRIIFEMADDDVPVQTTQTDQESPRFLVAASVSRYRLNVDLPYPKAGETYSIEVVSGWPFGDKNEEDYCQAKLSLYGTSSFPAGDGCSVLLIGDRYRGVWSGASRTTSADSPMRTSGRRFCRRGRGRCRSGRRSTSGWRVRRRWRGR